MRIAFRARCVNGFVTLSDGQMRILCTVVLSAAKIMVIGEARIFQSCTVRRQFVGDDALGIKPCFFANLRISLSAAFLFRCD